MESVQANKSLQPIRPRRLPAGSPHPVRPREKHQAARDARSRDRVANPRCVVCGAENRNGLRLDFHAGAAGTEATWLPSEEWESFQGTVHGGIVTAVLDEAMSRAVIARGWRALTADLRVRFHARVRPGEQLQVQGWIVERRRRKIVAEARLLTATGVERAHGWGVFLTVPPGN